MMKRGKKDHRTSNLTRRQGMREIKQSFLIVCEGEKTEPDYFKAFRMTAATIKAVGQAMNTVTLVNKAVSIRDADRKKKRIYDQCWVVFDKDDLCALGQLYQLGNSLCSDGHAVEVGIVEAQFFGVTVG